MAITTMLRNIKDTGYPMRVKIWQLFTVKVWDLAMADALMVATTSVSLPLHKLFRSATGKKLGLQWVGGGMAVQSIYQTLWFAFWVAYVYIPFSVGSTPLNFCQSTLLPRMDMDGPGLPYTSHHFHDYEDALLCLLQWTSKRNGA